jgi:hypothetical protein
MARKCFISFKTEDEEFKKFIQDDLEVDMIDKSLDVPINSENEDYIMEQIRKDYLSDSTVTILLIGAYSNENLGWEEQKFLKRELQASLFNGKNNTKNGILGIVLPDMYDSIFIGSGNCIVCGKSHRYVNINNATVIKEFSYNYYIPNNKCAWSEADKYCVLVKWDDFARTPENYIEEAFQKRTSDISSKTKVKP